MARHSRTCLLYTSNVEADHLDFFKDLHDVEHSFRRFAELVPADGHVVANWDDAGVRETLEGYTCLLYTSLRLIRVPAHVIIRLQDHLEPDHLAVALHDGAEEGVGDLLGAGIAAVGDVYKRQP